MEEIEAEVKEYSESLVIEASRYRQKTWEERLKEAEVLEKILKPEAEEHLSLSKGRGKKGLQISAKVLNIRKQVAKAMGTSHDTFLKAKEIRTAKPELINLIM